MANTIFFQIMYIQKCCHFPQVMSRMSDYLNV